MITPDEVAGFDLVYAASTSWSERVSREWGTPVTQLLQCTDTRWFHPDRAEPDTGPALLFVGNSRGVYRYAVRSALAIGADLTLHGNDWTDFVERDQIASGGVDNARGRRALRLGRGSCSTTTTSTCAATASPPTGSSTRPPAGPASSATASTAWRRSSRASCSPSTTSTSSRAW